MRPRDEAHAWVCEIASKVPGFRGAFMAGSVAALPDDATLPPWSDVDVMVVVDEPPEGKAAKFVRNGVLLEGTWLASADVADPAVVRNSYHLAHALATGVVLDDPAGWLGEVMASVRERFVRHDAVTARVASVRSAVEAALSGPDPTGSLAEQAQAWVFPAGVTCHVLLVAGLRNPTVRRRYETVRELLVESGHLDLHERLLATLGSAGWSRRQAETHLGNLTRLYDAASPLDAPGYRFAGDVTAITRPVSIDGTADMVSRGFHREAAFWLVVAGSRALQKLARAGRDDLVGEHELAYAVLLSDLGIGDGFAAKRRAALDLLPEVDAVAAELVDRHAR